MEATFEVVPKFAGGPELRELVRAALACRTRVMEVIAETLQRMVQIGRKMVVAKEAEVEHGDFRAWLEAEQIVGEGEEQISYATARRWMQLARFDERHAGDLEKATTVNEAYRLAGILPYPEAAARKSAAAAASNVETIARIERDLEEQLRAKPLETWARPELEALENVLQRLSDLHSQVQERLGTPPYQGISLKEPNSGV